jgi:hypothetical protein
MEVHHMHDQQIIDLSFREPTFIVQICHQSR